MFGFDSLRDEAVVPELHVFHEELLQSEIGAVWKVEAHLRVGLVLVEVQLPPRRAGVLRQQGSRLRAGEDPRPRRQPQLHRVPDEEDSGGQDRPVPGGGLRLRQSLERQGNDPVRQLHGRQRSAQEVRRRDRQVHEPADERADHLLQRQVRQAAPRVGRRQLRVRSLQAVREPSARMPTHQRRRKRRPRSPVGDPSAGPVPPLIGVRPVIHSF
ncbi:UNVERIFIED_CONTAM: hypothetical protein PYX00_010732 [Menopon gallinae]|uniref:Uncharacterized protein n=1 Tax=Menopon gallinae TaxID=328185 RepID=A0AAW2HH97_9NEOP